MQHFSPVPGIPCRKEVRTLDNTEAFVRRHAGTVYRLAYAQLRSKPDADDVFQEVFFRYFRSHPVFDSEEHAKAWLIRVTLNCCKNVWQSPWRKDAPLPEELPALSREESQLEDALQSLPGKYRIVIHLYYYEGYATDEIAKILGIRPATVCRSG